MHPAALRIKDYTYDLPDEQIARYPLEERDQSRLLVYRDGDIRDTTYSQLPSLVPPETLLVFNQTKVVHARLLFQKTTGGKIEVFCLEPDDRYADVPTAMGQTNEVYWKCLVGGAARWKNGILQLQVNIDNGLSLTLKAECHQRERGNFILHFYWDQNISFADVLHYAGSVPLPPYLNREAEALDETRYQTIFAKEEGSVAAPTAALHFTDRLMEQLQASGVSAARVTLHVGAGTFRPVKSETMQDHDMHAEWIEVDTTLVQSLIHQIEAGKPIVAVGTTSARTLESLYWIGLRLTQGIQPQGNEIAVAQWLPYETTTEVTALVALQALLGYMQSRPSERLVTRTQIIIAPGYSFRIIKGLITNFHQPQSTLLLLVAALIGDSWKKVYQYALEEGFRFLSYGDGCLLWSRDN
jgi:S-adenosylmethionine:tRNA ribosyltransferase-isomerase